MQKNMGRRKKKKNTLKHFDNNRGRMVGFFKHLHIKYKITEIFEETEKVHEPKQNEKHCREADLFNLLFIFLLLFVFFDHT